MEQIEKRLTDIAAEADEIRVAMETVMEADEFDADEFDKLEGRAGSLADEKAKLEARAKSLQRLAGLATKSEFVSDGVPKVLVNRTNNDPYDTSEVRIGAPKSELRGRALRAVEQVESWEMSDAQKHHVSKLIERKDDARQSIARRVLETGSPTYKEAWAKAVTGRDALMSAEERQALSRAMTLTDGAGGFAVPFPIDPTLILLSEGSRNPFRRIGRVETITTDSWQGLASTVVTAAWAAEATEAIDNATTFTQPSVPVYKAQAFVPASIEIAQDYPNLAEDLVMIFSDAKDTLEAAAFAVGSGSAQPTGIVQAKIATTLTSATTDIFADEDVYTVHGTLGPKYRDRATWVANINVINLIRQFGTSTSFHAFTVDLTAGGPQTLLGRPVVEASGMDGTVTALSDNYILLFGDFSNFLIADRVGMNVQFIPFLTGGTANYPTGEVGWYTYWRVGSDSINDGAFELLNVT